MIRVIGMDEFEDVVMDVERYPHSDESDEGDEERTMIELAKKEKNEDLTISELRTTYLRNLKTRRVPFREIEITSKVHQRIE